MGVCSTCVVPVISSLFLDNIHMLSAIGQTRNSYYSRQGKRFKNHGRSRYKIHCFKIKPDLEALCAKQIFMSPLANIKNRGMRFYFAGDPIFYPPFATSYPTIKSLLRVIDFH